MSDDSLSFPLPLSRFEADSCEATNLYREQRKPLLRYLVCLGLSADEAQDVVQDAFLSLHRHLASDRSQENLRSWLFRVAHNGARNRQHSYDRSLRQTTRSRPRLDCSEATPEQVVLEKEKLHRLGKAILLLTEPERECLLLRAGGLRYREIAEVLQIPTSTVGDTVDRAIKKLAEKCNV